MPKGISGSLFFFLPQEQKRWLSFRKSFDIPQRVKDNPEFAMIAKTRYGAKYLSLIFPLLSGQMFTVHGVTKPMSDIDDETHINTKGLDQLIKAMGKVPTARIGILGDNTNRQKNKNTNATVGAAHEFGTEKLPIRSFLRIPISENMDKYLEKSGAFDTDAIKKVIKESSLFVYWQKIALVGERIVADAFSTGGFGKWKPSDMTHKKNQQTLVETKQLRDSIASDVRV